MGKAVVVRETWVLVCLLGLLPGCAARPPASCVGLTGVQRLTTMDGQGRTVAGYDYASEGARIRHLTCRSDLGERRAVVDLGRAYETGRGVARDERRAVELFEQAAQDRATHTSIYTPPVRLGGRGGTMLLSNPGGGPGDAEAKYRLGRMLIEGRGTAPDPMRGEALIEDAIGQGFHVGKK